MSASLPQVIRAYLRSKEEGATVREIFEHVGRGTINAVSMAIRDMPDTYRDRWTDPMNGQVRQIFCVVEVPEDCPKPRRSAK